MRLKIIGTRVDATEIVCTITYSLISRGFWQCGGLQSFLASIFIGFAHIVF